MMTSAQLLTVEDTGENIFKVDGKDIGMVINSTVALKFLAVPVKFYWLVAFSLLHDLIVTIKNGY